MRTVQLPDGTLVPAIGQGTWPMGANPILRANEVTALRFGIDRGMTLIDTAEDYCGGESERVVADAIDGQRDRVFIVTKVHPTHAESAKMVHACEQSLKRLRINSIDLYLLHWWRGVFPELRCLAPLHEIVGTFETLKQMGKIKRWGVSNFSLDEMRMLQAIPSDSACTVNEVSYSLDTRAIEQTLLPWKACPIIAHQPLGIRRSTLLAHPLLQQIGDHHDATPAQIALAWVVRHAGVITIPKAGRRSHVRENALAGEIQLTQEDYRKLERAFFL